MNRTALRLRAELEEATGVDFARYADRELADALTGWTGTKGIARDLLVALAVAGAVIVTAILAAWLAVSGFDPRAGLVIGGVVAGLGAGVWSFSSRLRRRIPTEVERVIGLSERLAGRVTADLRAGRLSIGANQLAEGLAVVAVIPAVAAATRKRAPLVGLLVAPLIANLLTRILVALWPRSRPAGGAGISGDGVERLVAQALEAARPAILPRLGRGVRWATLPLTAAGLILTVMGVTVAALSLL
jgi:hypothetical protein